MFLSSCFSEQATNTVDAKAIPTIPIHFLKDIALSSIHFVYDHYCILIRYSFQIDNG
ncbi:hypothetical protein HMPREF1232_2233 [Streptococcus pyogenes GA40468]|nr:hypothetical protein HMPREF1232_2233 [Streptococcus pyogenes GA40468]